MKYIVFLSATVFLIGINLGNTAKAGKKVSDARFPTQGAANGKVGPVGGRVEGSAGKMGAAGGTGLQNKQSNRQTTRGGQEPDASDDVTDVDGEQEEESSAEFEDDVTDVDGKQEEESSDEFEDDEDTDSGVESSIENRISENHIDETLSLNPMSLVVALKDTPTNVLSELAPQLENLSKMMSGTPLKDIFSPLASVLKGKSLNGWNSVFASSPELLSTIENEAEKFIATASEVANTAFQTASDMTMDFGNMLPGANLLGPVTNVGVGAANILSNVSDTINRAARSSAKLQTRSSARRLNSASALGMGL